MTREEGKDSVANALNTLGDHLLRETRRHNFALMGDCNEILAS